MNPNPPRIAIIGGSGLGDALGAQQGNTHFPDTPFGKPSAPIVELNWQGATVLLLQRHGIGHVHNPSAVPYRANIFALKSLGVTHILASGATGSLREHIHPGQLVLVDQIIDKTTQRPSTFYDHAAVHVELADPVCPVMRSWLIDAHKKLPDTPPAEGGSPPGGLDEPGGLNEPGGLGDYDEPGTHAEPRDPNEPNNTNKPHLHPRGTYICMEGPSFSTRAESEMHRAWGGDLIGMTAMPEAKLAREAEIAYALIAMPTDYDCWRPHDSQAAPQALLEEIIGNLQRATAANIALMKQALRDTSMLAQHPSPAHSALKLGIWSDKRKINPTEIARLEILWGKYFEKGVCFEKGV